MAPGCSRRQQTNHHRRSMHHKQHLRPDTASTPYHDTIVNTIQLVAGDRQWPYHVHGIYTMCIYVHTLDSPITCMEVWDHHKFTRGPDTLEIGLPASSPRQMTGSLRPHSGRLGDRRALDCSALCFMITSNIIQNMLNLLEI